MHAHVSHYHVAAINYAIAVRPAEAARPHPVDFLRLINVIARYYTCFGDEVRGFLLAQGIIHGMTIEEPAIGGDAANAEVDPPVVAVVPRAQAYRFYISGLATGTFCMPPFQPYNIVCTLADVRHVSYLDRFLADDAAPLDTFEYPTLLRLGALVDAKYSLAVSNVLLYQNITGTVLTQFLLNEAPVARIPLADVLVYHQQEVDVFCHDMGQIASGSRSAVAV